MTNQNSLRSLVPGCLIIVVLAGTLFFVNIGADGRFSRAESYFAVGARSMLETGDRLLMHSPQERPLNKPPIEYWMIGTSFMIFGVDYGPSRIPSGVFALAILILVCIFGTRFYGKLAAITAAAMLMTSWLFISFARTGMSDMLVTLCVTVTICCWMTVLEAKPKYPARLALIGHAAMAVGFLVKGPVVILLSGTPFFIELIISRDLGIIRKLRPLSGVVLFILIASPYFLLVYLREGIDPLRAWFIDENVRRFTGDAFTTRTSIVEYPFSSILAGFAPWSVLLLFVAYWDFRQRKSIKTGHRTLRLLYLWMTFPVAFFALSRFKLDYYILPAMPAAALITGRMAIQDHFQAVSPRRILYLVTAIVVACLIIGSGFLLFAPLELSLPDATSRYVCALLIIFSMIPIIMCLYQRRSEYMILTVAFAVWVLSASTLYLLAPQLSPFRSVSRLAASIPAETDVYIYGDADEWTGDVIFRVPVSKAVSVVQRKEPVSRIKELLEQERQAAVLLYDDDLIALQDIGFKPRVVDQSDVYVQKRITLTSLLNPQPKRLYLVVP